MQNNEQIQDISLIINFIEFVHNLIHSQKDLSFEFEEVFRENFCELLSKSHNK